MTNFWREKGQAVKRNVEAGRAGFGAQARDTRHMTSLAAFVRQMFVDAGLHEDDVFVDRAIPGYYRRSKNWDVVATHKGHLVGVVELKSQVGSEGNNGNNRIEEALGNAFDAGTAQELKPSVRFPARMDGLLCHLRLRSEFGEAGPDTEHPSVPDRPSLRRHDVWRSMGIAVERFVLTGVYDAGWMAVTWVDGNDYVDYEEPVAVATAETLWTQIEARVRFAKQALIRK